MPMALSWIAADQAATGEAASSRSVEPGGSARVFSLPGQVLETNHPGNIAGLDEFLEAIVGLAGAQAGVIRALTHDGGYMRLVSAVGLSEAFLQRELLISVCGVCGDAVRDDEIHSASDFRGCSQLFSAHRGGGRCFRHVVAVPLEYKGQPVGVFNLFYDHPEDCKPNIKTLLPPIGQLLGLTLENSILERERSRASIVHERQAMAADIHDSLAQTLAFGRMRVPLIEDAICAHDTQQALKFCAEVKRELTQAHGALRGLITHFRAGMDSGGLRRGLREAIARFREASGIPLEFENLIPDLKLRGEAEVQVFYIVQEALANVCKHAKATRTRMAIERVDGGVDLSIEDNGVGCVVGQFAAVERGEGQGSYGLRIMRERAERFGGRLEVECMPKGGTRVRVFIPEDAVTGGTGGVRDE
jgi:two-component system nitrate/nitrite sensor histidine kinase NarX